MCKSHHSLAVSSNNVPSLHRIPSQREISLPTNLLESREGSSEENSVHKVSHVLKDGHCVGESMGVCRDYEDITHINNSVMPLNVRDVNSKEVCHESKDGHCMGKSTGFCRDYEDITQINSPIIPLSGRSENIPEANCKESPAGSFLLNSEIQKRSFEKHDVTAVAYASNTITHIENTFMPLSGSFQNVSDANGKERPIEEIRRPSLAERNVAAVANACNVITHTENTSMPLSCSLGNVSEEKCKVSPAGSVLPNHDLERPSFEEQTAAAVASACNVFSCLLKNLAKCKIVIKLSSSLEPSRAITQSPELKNSDRQSDLCAPPLIVGQNDAEHASCGMIPSPIHRQMQDCAMSDVCDRQGYQTENPEKENTLEPDDLEDFADATQLEEDDDHDGLKKLWEDMDFSRACLNGQEEKDPESHIDTNDECDHTFFLKHDIGLVCSLCGLVGRGIETWFDISWPNAKRRKKNNSSHPMEVGILETFNRLKEPDGSGGLKKVVVKCNSLNVVKVQPRYNDKMHPHQKEGFHFLERNLAGEEPSGCILAHAPGTGKTFLIISFLQSFLEAFPNERPLIIAPKIMLSIWVNEFSKWKANDFPVLNIYDIHNHVVGTQECTDGQLNKIRCSQHQILEKWKANKSVLLMSYPQFSALVNHQRSNAASMEIRNILLQVPGLLILDEGHNPRNSDTKLLEGLLQVQTKRRVLLSGTIFQNNFNELFNLFHLVRPEFLEALLDPGVSTALTSSSPKVLASKLSRRRSGKEAKERKLFRNVGDKIMFGSREERSQAIALLHHLSQPFVHWYKGQVLQDLPGLIDFTIVLNLNPAQEEALALIQKREKGSEHSSSMAIEHSTSLVCIHPSLLKVAPCPQQQHNCEKLVAASENENEASMHVWQDKDKDPRSGVKTKFIMDMLRLCETSKEKVLIFCRYLDPLTLVGEMLQQMWKWDMNVEMVRISGNTTLEEREIIIDKFNQDTKVRVLFASIMTCGEGISLTGASRVILLDVHWNPAVTRQAISRAFRIGQKRRVFVYRLVGAGTMEEETHLKAREKEWIAKSIFEGCDADDYEAYLHEVDPLQEDHFFESRELRQNIKKCYRCCFL